MQYTIHIPCSLALVVLSFPTYGQDRKQNKPEAIPPGYQVRSQAVDENDQPLEPYGTFDGNKFTRNPKYKGSKFEHGLPKFKPGEKSEFYIHGSSKAVRRESSSELEELRREVKELRQLIQELLKAKKESK